MACGQWLSPLNSGESSAVTAKQLLHWRRVILYLAMVAKKESGKKGKIKKEEPTKSQYLAKIAEMNAVLAQVRRETFDIWGVHYQTDKRYEQLQEDMKDIMKYLEHEIKVCENEIASYDYGIEKCTREMRKHQKQYDLVFMRMDEEFEAKSTELTDKIQSVKAKLNSFEEVRRQREEFVKRQDILEQLTQEMELRQKYEIYEAEKQTIIEQDKLQKEMEKRLAELALNFREATDIRIGETTNRIIGENIKLGNMLTCQQELLSKLRDNYTSMKKIQRHASLDLELKQDEYNLTYEKYAGHVEKIEQLLQTVEDLTTKIEDLKNLVKINRRVKRKIAELECSFRDLTSEHATLAKSLEEVEELMTSAKGNLNQFQKNILRLETTLFEVAKRVKEAIECENSVYSELEKMLHEKEEDSGNRENTTAQEELEKENIYRKRELLIEEILTKLQAGSTSIIDLHMTVSSTDSYDINFSYRGSREYSPTSKRSEPDETIANEEQKNLAHH